MTESRCNKEQISENLQRITETIAVSAQAAGRDVKEITLMAVTKTVPPELVNAAAAFGVPLFGENRAQELREKIDQYSFGPSSIHFIGTLQSNKVRLIIEKVACIQSVNSLSLAQEINHRAKALGRVLNILLEVNIGREDTKCGILPEHVIELAEKVGLLEYIRVKGLMCIPPAGCKLLETERYFAQMYNLFVDIKHKKLDNITMETLSMGMSGDYAAAIRHGSTLVRIGAGIFGSRNFV